MSASENGRFMHRILTIGVPTYNRAHILAAMLTQLVEDIGEYASKIEVIISDNCSTDSTPSIIADWRDKVPSELVVRVHRNSENIGVSRNIIQLFSMAETRFFMFLGDDDRLSHVNLPRMIELLESDNAPSALICAYWDGIKRGRATGYISFEDAAHLFYEYGNAWAAVIDREAAQHAIDARNLRPELEKIVWPQTVIGFLAMHDLPNRKIFAADFELGGQLGPAQNVTNKAYWVRSLYGLLKAATLVDHAIGGTLLRNTFVNHRTPGFITHVKSILYFGLIADHGSSTSELRRLLRSEFGWKGLLWSQVIALSDHQRLLEAGAQAAYLLGRGKGSAEFARKLQSARSRHSAGIAQALQGKQRYGDWF